MPLRPYQQDALRKVEAELALGRRVLLTLPTGAGKTQVAAALLERAKGNLLFLVPWRELAFQGAARFEAQGLTTSVLLDGKALDPEAAVVVSTIQTATNRKFPKTNLVIIDEAHRAPAAEAAKLLKRLKAERVVGLTATPVRYDGQALGKVFDSLVVGATTRQLVEQGYLVRLDVYSPDRPLDLERMPINPGSKDWRPRPLGEHMERPDLLGDAVAHYRKHAAGMRALAFCCTVRHAEVVAEAFRAAGVPSDFVSGETPKGEREAKFKALEAGRIKVLANVAVLTEGIDFPWLEALILLRPTMSPGLHLQIIGRGMRPATGKARCVVLDHADNFRRHGDPRDDWRWSLRGKAATNNTRALPAAPHKAAERTCPACGNPCFVAASLCPACGWDFLPLTKPGHLAERTWSRQTRALI